MIPVHETRSMIDEKLAASEERVSHEIASIRLALATLGTDLATVDRETKRLGTSINQIPSVYATKNEQQALQEKLQNETSADMARLRADLERLENDKVEREEMHTLTNAISLKVQNIENMVNMQTLSVDGLKNDQKVLENRVVEEFVSLSTFNGLVASMRKKIEHDYEVLRRNVFSYRDSVRDIQGAIEQGYELSSDIAALQRRCGKHDEELASLRGLEKEHWEASSAALHKQNKEQVSLQSWCRALQQELGKQAEETMEQTDHVRKHSTRLSLEHMDKALGIHRSIAELEKSHMELQHSVRSIQLPRL